MESRSEIELPDFEKMPDGLVPAIAQDVRSGVVLMLGYMNQVAFEQTLQSGRATFFSRSRRRLWMKGESSGNTLRVAEWRLDCDRDAILLKVIPDGPVCHTGQDTCWNEENKGARFLPQLEQIILKKKQDQSDKHSYTVQLLQKGIPKIAQKVGEEAVETVIEALGENRDLFLNEAADLLYHLLVLMAAKEVRMAEVEAVLAQRHNQNLR